MAILIAEDESISRNLLKNILEKEGHVIFEAEDGNQAWEQYKKNDIKMLITDWLMPGMDGLTLCKKIRSQMPGHYVYIIVITAKENKEDIVRGFEAGADDFITKPFNPGELRARIRAGERIMRLEEDFMRVNRELEVRNNRLVELYLHSNRMAREAKNSFIELQQVFNIKNISGKRREEAMQKAKLKAEASNLAKSEFLANMSHEIRTPLNAVIGMTELMMDTGLDHNQQDIMDTIISEANSLLRLINDILDFSRIEAGRLELEKSVFDLRIMLEDIVKGIRPGVKRKGLDLSLFLGPDVPIRLIGDPGRLRQILNNLVGNALKFTRTGEICIKGEVEDLEGEEIRLRFIVRDTGIGIPMERQAEILERFTQADGSITREYGGSGLGTAIAKQLAELMGGKIGFASEEGKGTTFWFTARFSMVGEEEDIPGDETDELKPMKMLVVDQNIKERHTLMESLDSWACSFMEAGAGREALYLIGESLSADAPPELILINFQMPDMDGFDLAREIRLIKEMDHTSIVLLTSVGKIGDCNICKEIGIEGYLSKPVKDDELSSAIELVVKHTRRGEVKSIRGPVTKHTVAEERRKDIRVLLAEDYPTNQKVAMKYLIDAGFQVDLAENGKQAVDLFRLKHYDLIFMDIQMPIKGGFEATREIRKLEIQNASRDGEIKRTPIIAMTAHALRGYRDKCLKEGMDDYISKPLRRRDLLKIVTGWTSGNTGFEKKQETDVKKSINTAPDSWSDSESPEKGDESREIVERAPMNFDSMVDEFKGDKSFLIEVLEDFLGEVRVQSDSICQAISEGDGEKIKNEAHAIKGGALNMSAEPLSRVAYELEKIGKSGDAYSGKSVFKKLEREFQRLEEYIREKREIHQ